MKSLYGAIALLLIQCGPAKATDVTCMNDYYRAKLPACVDAVLSQFGQMATTPGTKSEPSAVVGFLAHIFITSPAEKQRILGSTSSVMVKWVDLLALHYAGLTEEARKFADENRLATAHQQLETSQRAPLATVRPTAKPADNDLLIGAYMASGDTIFIDRILGNFTDADDGIAGDAFRMGLVKSKFGPNLAPKGREAVITQAACTRYRCKADPAKFFRLMTLASAFWALQSVGQNDEGIKTTAAGFFGRDARLKNLLAAEQAAFGNYITAIAITTAFKPDQGSTDTDQTYAAMNKAALAYENLEPAGNVFGHIEAFVKAGKQPNGKQPKK